jgi:hypothetical protein
MCIVGNGMENGEFVDLEYSDEKLREAWVVGETRREYKKQQRGGRKLARATHMRKSKRN